MSEAQVLHFFAGKGGAGKTTLAASFALTLSEDNPKDKVLLVSLSPEGALSDVLKKKLSPKPTKLQAGKGVGGLFAAELDPVPLGESLSTKVLAELAGVAQKGQLVAADDARALLEPSALGMSELASLVQLLEWLETKTFDRIIVDGLSTSHMLRLVDTPSVFRRALALARGEKPTKGAKKEVAPAAGPMAEFVSLAERLLALLRDSGRTVVHVTTLAEPVPEAQTRHLFHGLRERQISMCEIVVNQVEERSGCPACHGRRGLQAPHVRKYQQLDKALPVALLQKREVAPRGQDSIKKLAKEWASGKETKALEFSLSEGPPALVRAPSMPPIAAPPLPPTRLIFFIGQGGVGKSSCAAAAAVTLTEKEGPVLLISTDPAHSLSEVLLSRLTDTETQVKGTKGLYARELDMAGWFANLRKRWREKAERAFGPEVRGQDVAYDRELVRNLIDCAPLCLDELAALCVLTDALVQERFKRIVVDPSPATDMVRLLELPEVAHRWLGALVAVLSKYRAKGLGELADEVASMQRHIKRFEAALASPAESRFVVVTRGEEMAALKSERVVEYLKVKRVAVERVLVNRVLPKSTCAKCENRRKNELIHAKNMEKKIGLPITVAPALGRHPAGLRELKAFRTAWYALSATAKVKAA